MQLLKNKWFIAFIVLGILGGSIGILLKNGNGYHSEDTYTVTRSDLINEVIVSGVVVPVDDADLSFDRSGVVESILVDVGDAVVAGDTLVTLAAGDIVAQLNQAYADLDAERAVLNELLTGTRPEEIAIKTAQLTQAATTLNDTEQSAIDTLDEVLTAAEDAVFNNVDQFYNNPRTPFPKFNKKELGVEDLDKRRVDVEDVLEDWEERISDGITVDEIDSEFDNARTDLLTIQPLVDDVTEAINRQDPVSASDNAIVAAAQQTIAAALADISRSEEEFNAARTEVAVAEDELALAQAGSTAEDINRQEAVVRSKEASVDRFNADFDKTLLRSPIDGIVTVRNADPGESVSALSPVLKIISAESLEVTADISELEIAHVGLDNTAQITLDAYGDDTIFSATVIEIDPAETIIDNVPTYGVTLQFDTTDTRIKSGMTANVSIVTSTQTNALSLPLRYISGTTVTVLIDNTTEERTVTFGTIDSRGNIEVVDGLEAGDIVVLPERPGE